MSLTGVCILHLQEILNQAGNELAVLEATGWRISGPGGAAHSLGIKLSTLAYRMKIFGINKR